MRIFSRMLKRFGATPSSCGVARTGTRSLRIEPLEERRMLAVIPAPVGFKAEYDIGSLNEQIDIEFEWADSVGETGYEIQRSITGFDDAPAHPDLWEEFGEPLGQDRFAMPFNDGYRRYYFRLRSTGHTESPFVSEWTDPIFAVHPNPLVAITVPEDNIVKVSAIAHSAIESPALPAKIELQWPEELAYVDAEYTIYRKEKDETSFTQVAFLSDYSQSAITGWVDDDLQDKTAYEYKVVRTRNDDSDYFPSTLDATGYIYAGVDVPLDDDDSTIESPGTVILVVDETQKVALQAELDRLEDDLFAEGWDVEVIDDVNPGDTPASVRTKIKTKYDNDPTNVKAVFLIGHIPIPMSGWNSPDGHGPRPFPADVFYGDMDDVWTDTTRNTDLRGYQGNYRYNTAGTGDDVASWTFTGLTPGEYEVSVSWAPRSNRAINAPFTIYDDTTLKAGPILVNQQGSATADQDLTPCSRAGKVRLVSKTPYFSWETAL